jgi:peptidoglycan-associated lipoprotein
MLVAGLLVGSCGHALAQSGPRLELGVNYTYVRSNAPAGGCGCFSMNGGGGSFAYRLFDGWSVVGEVNAVRASNIGAGGADLTLVSYLAGARYSWHHSSRLVPFGELLLGGAHASGSLTPGAFGGPGTPNAFAMTTGGGLDIRLNRRWAIRVFQADYFFTDFVNGVNDHQNNLRISAGLLYRFGGK